MKPVLRTVHVSNEACPEDIRLLTLTEVLWTVIVVDSHSESPTPGTMVAMHDFIFVRPLQIIMYIFNFCLRNKIIHLDTGRKGWWI